MSFQITQSFTDSAATMAYNNATTVVPADVQAGVKMGLGRIRAWRMHRNLSITHMRITLNLSEMEYMAMETKDQPNTMMARSLARAFRTHPVHFA